MENEAMIEFDKIIFILKGIYKSDPEKDRLLEIATYSEFEFEEDIESLFARTWQVYKVTIHTQHDIYIKHFDYLNGITETIKKDLAKLCSLPVNYLRIVPDYNKLEVINSEIHPVYTEWDEINKGQFKLIGLLKRSSDSLEFRNIGNTSRAILQKLAQIVFDPEKHIPGDKSIDISGEKYKNQLHTYIRSELSGETNKELRQFAEASINTVEKAIDLANTITHKIEVEKSVAEVCVIGTIGAISIVKFVESNRV